MMYFTSGEIIFSVLASSALGISFSLLISLISLIIPPLRAFIWRTADSLRLPMKGLLRRRVYISEGELSGAGIFITVISFTVLFILISYLTLDGEIRIYTLLITLFFAFITRYFLRKSLSLLLKKLFEYLILLYSLTLSLLVLPIRGTILLSLRIFGRSFGKTNHNLLDEKKIYN